MTDILDEFDIFLEIVDEFKKSIKLFHVFDDIIGKNVFVVTNEDEVFAFGSNRDGVCGFGHQKKVDAPTEIPELSGKQIKKFLNGSQFVLSLNKENHVFGWGLNYSGQLGRGHTNDLGQYQKPEIIPNLENIIEISCGLSHSLALGKQGNVFSWGNNSNGQVGSGKKFGEHIMKPVQLKVLSKIISIRCFGSRSFAVTIDGLVYSWGSNYHYCLGHDSETIDKNIYVPKLINGLNNIISVGFSSNSHDSFSTYFLTYEGIIYFCGEIGKKSLLSKLISHEKYEYQKIPKILETDLKFQSLQTVYYYSGDLLFSGSLALSEETVHCLKRNSIQKTKYKTFFIYCMDKMQITSKTFEFNFRNRFEKLSDLGSGSFGTVIKVKSKINDKLFAVKVIKGIDQDIIKEVKILLKCSEEYVVKCFGSWIERNELYIQMECCSDSLNNVIEQKKESFGRKTFEPMNTTEFFISSQFFKEILECVQYLHELNPPIIHRDLKPRNILVNYVPKNGRFVKLCDFGLSRDSSRDSISYTANIGTPRYMAPELSSWGGDRRSRYNEKVDIFSLNRIAQELFDFDINDLKRNIANNIELNEKWNKLEEVIIEMMNSQYHKRPSCGQILERFELWGIIRICETPDEYKNQFFKNFLNHKLKHQTRKLQRK